MKCLRTYIFFALLSSVFAVNLYAATRTTSQTGNWSATSTWGGASAPVAGDNVIVNGGFTVTVDISNAACLSIQLGGSTLGTGSGTLSFNTGSQLTVSGDVTLGVTTNTPGTINMATGGTLRCAGFVDNRLGTWTAGTGTIDLTATNTVPNNNNINFNNLIVSGGTTTLSRNVTVAGNLTINLGAVLNGGANTTTVDGDWSNNGTFDGNTGTVSFDKNGNQSISGTGLNNFNLIRVNMGTSILNTLEVTASQFSAPDGFLTLTNGTFKVSGSFTLTNTFLAGPGYNVPPTTGLWINNPNVTVTAQGGIVSIRGMLRLSAGTYNIGNGADSSVVYVSGSSFIIEGGVLNIAGRLSGNNASSTTSYTQSGGTVTVVKQGSTDPVFAGFDLGNAGSSFTMSGGSIVVANATSATADFRNIAGAASVTGGTLQIGDASTLDAQIIRIQSTPPLGNLLVSNATGQATKPTAQILTAAINVLGNVTIQAGTTFDANGFSLTLGGDWTDSGTFIDGGSDVTFNGGVAQSISAASQETFNAVSISKSGGTLTLNTSLTVKGGLFLTQGSLAVGANTLTLNGLVSGGGVLTSSATGTVDYNQGSDGQALLIANYGNLVFSNFTKVFPSTGTIGIAGSFAPGGAVGHTVAGSTIDFNGGSQSVPAFPYNNLTLSGSGTKTAGGVITVNGSFVNTTGIIFSVSSTLDLVGATHANGGKLNVSTLRIESGASLSNNGTVTAGGSLAGPGTLTQGAAGILNIGASVDSTVLIASAVANTVNYSGFSQPVLPVKYYHLTLSGSGSPNLAGVSTIDGNFSLTGSVAVVAAQGLFIGGNASVGLGTSFDAGTFTHTLQGNWADSGSFSAGSSTFAFNGTSMQTMNGSTFSSLVIDNATEVSMLGDVTVKDTLRLSSGGFVIGSHGLTVDGAIAAGGGTLVGGSNSNVEIGGSAAGTTLPGLTLNNLSFTRSATDSIAADVTINGNLTISQGSVKTGPNSFILGSTATLSEAPGHPLIGSVRTTRNVVATSGVESFGNLGAEIRLNGTALGSTSVTRKTGIVSTGNGHSSISRYFDIAALTNAGLNAGLTLHYDTSELNGQNATALELFVSHDNGSTWNNQGGAANAGFGTVSVSGINDFSRWTISDTSNRIGNTPLPAVASILPPSKHVGDPGFTLTLNGSGFVEGKSTVRFNGNDRATTYINSTQLTASIPASDLHAVGSDVVTVFNAAGGGSSNAQTFTVDPLPPTKVRVETAADGSGTVVPTQSIAAGSSLTVYAITRDTVDNFVENVTATSWALGSISGGIVSGDLVPALDGKSAVFTGHLVGSATISATSASLAVVPSAVLSVIPGASTKVRVETAADGSGTVVPAHSIPSGASATVFGITRDALDNFVANVSADVWSVDSLTGGVVAGDLVPSVDRKSAVFNAHAIGSAVVRASSGALAVIGTGRIRITAGTATKLTFETAANGSGTVVPAGLLASGDSITIFAVTRDSQNNFISNAAADTWTVTAGGGVASGDLVPSVDKKSAIFTGHVVGTAIVSGTAGALTPTSTGLITVIHGNASKVLVETAADGFGTLVPAESVRVGNSFTVFAITRDASNNLVANVVSDAWTLVNVTGGIVPGDLVPSLDGKSAVFTAHEIGSANIRATSGALTVIESGTISTIPITGVVDGNRPFVYALAQNYPNPFNPSTTIKYSVAKAGRVSLTVFDVLGRVVDHLVQENREPGEYLISFHADHLPSGCYFIRMVSGEFIALRKMVVMR